jgi:2,3-dihydroxybenzoate-AMP ligase
MLDGFVPWPEEVAERYRQLGYWRGEVLGSLLRGPAAEAPDQVAVVAHGRRHTYAELDAAADRLAAGLHALGIRAGDRIVVHLPNSVEFVTTCVAVFRIGALPVLALPAHRRSELIYLAEYAGAVALVVTDAELAREVVAVPTLREVLVAGEPGGFTRLAEVTATPAERPGPDPSDVAFFLLSGGTTGLPKLIPRTHDDYSFQLRATARAMGFGPDGVYLAVLPAAHNAALGCPGVLGALRAGGRAVLARNASPDEVFPLIDAEGVTLTTVMPPILALWTDMAPLFGADLSGVTIEVGGATLSPEVARRVRPTLGATLTHWFGMAEGVLSFTRPGDPDDLAATTQGHPLCDADEYRVVGEDGECLPPGDVGHLLARGPCTLRGYYAVPEHNATVFTADGFLRTGDLARITPAGHLAVSGRVKEIINRGGEKVSADEVEAHLMAHSQVRSAALIALPDRTLGEKSCAVIVPRGPAPTLAELKEFLAGRGLAEFKLPDRMETMEALPLTSAGKVDKIALVARIAG